MALFTVDLLDARPREEWRTLETSSGPVDVLLREMADEDTERLRAALSLALGVQADLPDRLPEGDVHQALDALDALTATAADTRAKVREVCTEIVELSVRDHRRLTVQVPSELTPSRIEALASFGIRLADVSAGEVAVPFVALSDGRPAPATVRVYERLTPRGGFLLSLAVAALRLSLGLDLPFVVGSAKTESTPPAPKTSPSSRSSRRSTAQAAPSVSKQALQAASAATPSGVEPGNVPSVNPKTSAPEGATSPDEATRESAPPAST